MRRFPGLVVEQGILRVSIRIVRRGRVKCNAVKDGHSLHDGDQRFYTVAPLQVDAIPSMHIV